MKTLLVSNTHNPQVDTKALLEQNGHDVVAVEDGVSAWIQLCDAETPFQVVISDWSLPEPLDAMGLCKKIRSSALSDSTHIIMLTNRTVSSDLAAGVEAGVDDFLTAKPFNIDLLESKLRIAERILDLQKTVLGKENVIKALNTKLEQQSNKDKLTALHNRRAFHFNLEDRIRLARRMEQPISIIMLDVDKFQFYKDEYGVTSGDGVVKLVSNSLKENSRTSDFVARFGAEKFGIILPCTDHKGAMICAEGLRKGANNLFWESEQVTVSIGATTIDKNNYGSEAVCDLHTRILSESDQALFQAKSAGHNQISHFADLERELEVAV